MQDNNLYRLILPIISADLEFFGFENIKILQAYQPTQQGVNTLPTIYYYKVNEKRVGYSDQEYQWNSETEEMINLEKQWYETTLQFQALVIQDPTNTNSFTASDLINCVAAILQSSKILEYLAQYQVGVYKIMDIQNPFFIDDKDRNEFSPYFQGIFTHLQTLQRIIPATNIINPGIFGV